MTVSLSDILTSVKNIPTALNGIAAAVKRGQGNTTVLFPTITAKGGAGAGAVICEGPGRLVSLMYLGGTDTTVTSVIADALSVADNTQNPGRVLYRLKLATADYEFRGYRKIDVEFTHGLFVLVSGDQEFNITYYQGP